MPLNNNNTSREEQEFNRAMQAAIQASMERTSRLVTSDTIVESLGTRESPDLRVVTPRSERRISFTSGDVWGRTVAANNNDDNNKVEELKPSTIVVTKSGKEYPYSECIYSEGYYYHKTDKEIVQDCITGKLIHKRATESVVIKVTAKTGKLKFDKGLTFYKNLETCPVLYSKKYNIDTKIAFPKALSDADFKEDISRGIFVDIDDTNGMSIKDVQHYDTYKNFFSKCTDYKTLTKLGVLSPSYTITEGLRYTFGVEIETCRGFLPTWKAASGYNVLCVRDGSINNGEGGGEYVTGILKGDTGFNHLQEICLELSKRTLINSSCGIHTHIGNVNFSKQFLVNSYRLALLLENEIFSTLPKSRRNNSYCKKLKSFNFRPALNNTMESEIELEEDYNRLFRYISVEKVNNPTFNYNKSKQHPMGPKCGYNHDTPRYCWLNYVPAMFNTRENGSYSLEFRCMSGTTNFVKIKNWLLFNFAFIAFVERFPEEIVEGITMEHVINRVLPKKAHSLNRYFNLRKELFIDANKETDEYKQEVSNEKISIKELITN